MLVSYAYDRIKGQKTPIGCVVAENFGDTIRLGWSLCHKKDHFDKSIARELAAGRMLIGDEPVPHTLQKNVERMMSRASTYFKARNIELPIVS